MNILDYIPGFRTRKKTKMIIASIYYLLCIALISGGFSLFVFTVSMPLIVFGTIGIFSGKRKKRVGALQLGIGFLLLFGSVMPINSSDDTQIVVETAKPGTESIDIQNDDAKNSQAIDTTVDEPEDPQVNTEDLNQEEIAPSDEDVLSEDIPDNTPDSESEVPQVEDPLPVELTYIGNSNTKKFHKTTCSSAKKITNENRTELTSRDEAINAGYEACKICKP